jgi:AraC family transcriptional regulator of adaptative response / DNA-3-methyladenine glycosylase II
VLHAEARDRAVSPTALRLPYAGPFDWPAVLQFLSRRAIEGIERVDGDAYARTIRLGDAAAVIEIRHDAASRALLCSLSGGAVGAQDVAQRVRVMFDLDADLERINGHLARDPWLRPHVEARPAMRVFHGWDPFEVAMRSIIGQQVSVGRARDLNGVLVDRCSSVPPAGGGSLRRLFPTPAEVLAADLDRLGMPGARAATLKTVAKAALDDPRLFTRSASIDETIARLTALKGIGDWTAHYIAMRACGEPDAFPAGDVGLLRGAALAGHRPSPAELRARAQAWRPWRAYAAHHLWAIDPG